MREPWFVNEPVAHNCESQASVETERCVPPVGPECSDVLLPEFSDDVVKQLAPDAVAVHCRLHRHEAELHGGNVRRQRAWTRIEARDTRERSRAPSSQMPRAGQVIVTDMRGGEVSITEYPRPEVVGVSGGDTLNLDHGHGAILTRFAPRSMTGHNPQSCALRSTCNSEFARQSDADRCEGARRLPLARLRARAGHRGRRCRHLGRPRAIRRRRKCPVRDSNSPHRIKSPALYQMS